MDPGSPVKNSKKQRTVSSKQTRERAATDVSHVTRRTHPATIIGRASIAPESLTSADVLQLQRTIGNRAVGGLLADIKQGRSATSFASVPQIQAKLTINPPGDKYEQEADRVAKRVVRQIDQSASKGQSMEGAIQRQPMPEEEELLQGKFDASIQRQPMPEEEELMQVKFDESVQRQSMPEEEELMQGKFDESVQRQPMPEEEELMQGKFDESIQRQPMPEDEELLQGKFDESVQRQSMPEEEELLQGKLDENVQMYNGGMVSSPDIEGLIKKDRGKGQHLPINVRVPMEQSLGVDLSKVRVHTDAQSNMINRSISARAFATGHDIFFRQGAYKPESRGGQELIAHELTHVVQQNGVNRLSPPSIEGAGAIQRYLRK